MIDPVIFLKSLKALGIEFFTGVPDSLLSDFSGCLNDQVDSSKHIFSANEGNAIAIALGYHISTGKAGLVYMQNSGLGNAVNPLCSLADQEVYKIPMLILIGWRGEPGIADEPQHIKQGRVTLDQLKVLEIPHFILEAGSNTENILKAAVGEMWNRNSPVAIVVRGGTFSKYQASYANLIESELLRESALSQLLSLTNDHDVIISTTGKTSRELYELRDSIGSKQQDFLTVGGMGHTSSIAFGVSIGQPSRRVICLDGDGSLLMHMGSMPVIGKFKPLNFIHVLLNNGSHESVGGQPTVANIVNFEKLASAVGYSSYYQVNTIDKLKMVWSTIPMQSGPILLEIRIKNGSRKNLCRPDVSPEKCKVNFMSKLGVKK